MDQLSDEEVEVREEEEEEEEDSDKEDQDLDKMFGAWLGELDKLTQVKHMSTVLICSPTRIINSVILGLSTDSRVPSSLFSSFSLRLS